jgi:hypothetical protein
MPSVIGSPTRQYTPPSSNDESNDRPLFHHHHSITSTPRTKHPTSSTSLNLATLQQGQDHSISPPNSASSSDDSPTTSGGDNNTFYPDDTEMLDYEDYTTTTATNLVPILVDESSSPEALFFGSVKQPHHHTNNSRFTSALASQEGFSSFSTPFNNRLKPNTSSPEFDPEADSPGIGSEMRGLRLNSRFPSPVQNTVRLEDVMLPTEDPTHFPATTIPGSLFETKPVVQHVENGLFNHPYYPFFGFVC